jgi:2-oxoglutarate ferredoxin oxidoreductase subunit alpha
MRNTRLQEKYKRIREKETRYEHYYTDDAELIVVAFGTAARISLASVIRMRREGFKVGLFRPVTLFPFPEPQIFQLAGGKRKFLTVEMNAGQMVEDVKLSVNGKSTVFFYGRPGGAMLTPEEVQERIMQHFRRQPQEVAVGVSPGAENVVAGKKNISRFGPGK